MRPHALLSLLAGGALASVARHECFARHSAALADFSDCGHHGALNYCLSHLAATAQADVETCYRNAGCSAREAAVEAQYVAARCEELSATGDLRRRYRAVVDRAAAAQVTAAPAAAAVARDGLLHQRASAQKTNAPKLKGPDCFSTSTVDTSSCPLQTSDGHVKTLSCFPTQVAASECAPGLMCTLDVNHEDICMKMQNGLDTGGIIVAIIFAVLVTLGLGSLTFLCCRDRRQQKRLVAKAEAVALARAQTKRQKAQEVRAPLMRQQEGAPGSPNPFHDGNQG
ncbi:hypothetical protein TOPH_07799 [Tolypocladium ophioglossoides CBS 100239]|uniref:Extracellular membrane protein CFEM domain-containing protein n=1 Tax=Tolypocladium ophioglossoides (strain CBS 100239) TaxID=1163406 RepID=A0A0L0N0C1_TOLOC|nr:hypothetical protein TOPH_07799 [Tolypocladium ophioglossoides CBS 100239]